MRWRIAGCRCRRSSSPKARTRSSRAPPAPTLLLSRTPRPTAIFAGNDETAAGVYRTAYLRGVKIPDELTVIGFDDSPLASRLCPSLTTMRQPIRDMGRMAAEKLIAKIAGCADAPADRGHDRGAAPGGARVLRPAP